MVGMVALARGTPQPLGEGSCWGVRFVRPGNRALQFGSNPVDHLHLLLKAKDQSLCIDISQGERFKRVSPHRVERVFQCIVSQEPLRFLGVMVGVQ